MSFEKKSKKKNNKGNSSPYDVNTTRRGDISKSKTQQIHVPRQVKVPQQSGDPAPKQNQTSRQSGASVPRQNSNARQSQITQGPPGDGNQVLEQALARFINACDHRFKNSEAKIKEHRSELDDHESRIARLEGLAASTATPVVTADPDPDPDPVPVAAATPDPDPAASAAPDPVSGSTCVVRSKERVFGPGVTGKELVFYIHDRNGKIMYDMPFASCLAAKRYDPRYEVVHVWVEDGFIIRELTSEEAATYEW